MELTKNAERDQPHPLERVGVVPDGWVLIIPLITHSMRPVVEKVCLRVEEQILEEFGR